MLVGTAWEDITPQALLPLQGQYRTRIARHTRDPLTANAVAFRHGASCAVLVSCDLIFLGDDFVREVQTACAERWNVPASAVLIACTHTHVGPFTTGRGILGRPDPAYMRGLRESLIRVVGRALNDVEDTSLYAGKGWIEHMGFNRRGMNREGQANMYYGSWNDDFACVEGPRDGSVNVLFARKRSGDVKVVLVSFATHPNCLEGEEFYSADIPGEVRRVLRRNLGDDLGVVYLTGCNGNTAPSQLENNREKTMPWRGEAGLRRSGVYLGAEILKVIAAAVNPMATEILRLRRETLQIPIRPWPESFDPNTLRAGKWRDSYNLYKSDWPRMLREESPVDVRLNVLRLGDAAVCTHPAELYVEHGLAVKKHAGDRVILIAGLCDGCVGYVPTAEAFKRGGYSTFPAPTSKLAENAGDIIASQTCRLLDDAFAGEERSQD